LFKIKAISVDTYEVTAVERRRRELATRAVALSAALVVLAWLGLGVGGKGTVRDFDDVVTALAALSACLACMSAATRNRGSGRLFWLLLSAALGAWTIAEVLWGVYDLLLHVAVPVPSWADVGYLGAIPLAAAALLCHPGIHSAATHRARAALDGVAIGAAVLLLSWIFVLGPLWRHTDLSTAGGIVALGYPFGDMVIIFLIVLSVRSMPATGRRPLLWVLLGLLAMALSDSAYAYLVEVGRYRTGSLLDLGWVVGYLAIAVGASSDAGEAVPVVSHERAEESFVSSVTPYVPVLVALSVVTFELELHHSVDRVSWLTGFGLALLVIARQALALFDRLHAATPENRTGSVPRPELVRRVP
jgi:hypothetical protein